MIKATVIKAQTVRKAIEDYGEETVQEVFELVRNTPVNTLLEELEEENLKKCLLFLLNDDIN